MNYTIVRIQLFLLLLLSGFSTSLLRASEDVPSLSSDSRRRIAIFSEADADSRREEKELNDATMQAMQHLAHMFFQSYFDRSIAQEQSKQKLLKLLKEHPDYVNKDLQWKDEDFKRYESKKWFAAFRTEQAVKPLKTSSLIMHALFYVPQSLQQFYRMALSNQAIDFLISKEQKSILEQMMHEEIWYPKENLSSKEKILYKNRLTDWMEWQEVLQDIKKITPKLTERTVNEKSQLLKQKIELLLNRNAEEHDLKLFIDFESVLKDLDIRVSIVKDSFKAVIESKVSEKSDEIAQYLQEHKIVSWSAIKDKQGKLKDLLGFLKTKDIDIKKYVDQTIVETVLNNQAVSQIRSESAYEALPEHELVQVKDFLDQMQDDFVHDAATKARMQSLLDKHKKDLDVIDIEATIQIPRGYGLFGYRQEHVRLPLLLHALLFAPKGLPFLTSWADDNKVILKVTDLAEKKVLQYIKEGILGSDAAKAIRLYKKNYLLQENKKDEYGNAQVINLQMAPLLRAYAYGEGENPLVKVRTSIHDDAFEEKDRQSLTQEMKRFFGEKKNKKLLNTSMVVGAWDLDEGGSLVIALPLVLYAVTLGEKAIKFLESFEDEKFKLSIDTDTAVVLLNMYQEYNLMSEKIKNKFLKRLYLWQHTRETKMSALKAYDTSKKAVTKAKDASGKSLLHLARLFGEKKMKDKKKDK